MTSTFSDKMLQGLTNAEAQTRLQKFGPHAATKDKPHPLLQLISGFGLDHCRESFC
jgi:hypothetical protein